MNDVRRAEILANGKWRETDFENIKAGDMFRLFESTGEPVTDKKGNSNFTAKTDAHITGDGVYGVDIACQGGDE